MEPDHANLQSGHHGGHRGQQSVITDHVGEIKGSIIWKGIIYVCNCIIFGSFSASCWLCINLALNSKQSCRTLHNLLNLPHPKFFIGCTQYQQNIFILKLILYLNLDWDFCWKMSAWTKRRGTGYNRENWHVDPTSDMILTVQFELLAPMFHLDIYIFAHHHTSPTGVTQNCSAATLVVTSH